MLILISFFFVSACSEKPESKPVPNNKSKSQLISSEGSNVKIFNQDLTVVLLVAADKRTFGGLGRGVKPSTLWGSMMPELAKAQNVSAEPFYPGIFFRRPGVDPNGNAKLSAKISVLSASGSLLKAFEREVIWEAAAPAGRNYILGNYVPEVRISSPGGTVVEAQVTDHVHNISMILTYPLS